MLILTEEDIVPTRNQLWKRIWNQVYIQFYDNFN
jgi:hypothetical protein